MDDAVAEGGAEFCRLACTPGSVGEVPGNRHLYPTQLCGVAERMDDAVAEGGTEFWCLASTPGGEETLLPPDLAPNRGEGVSEGRPLLAVPGGR